MTNQLTSRGLSRRSFFKAAGGTLAVLAGAGAGVLPAARRTLRPAEVSPGTAGSPDLALAGTDGWIFLPPVPALPPYHPDAAAPAPYTTYMFGFTNVTGLTLNEVLDRKGHSQACAPMWWIDQEHEYFVQLTNLGFVVRPDLVDAHTVHFHGFRNAIPVFDGEPHSSYSAPIGRSIVYYYKPHLAGTYMYHCHVEETEHVHMGMTGPVFVRPLQNYGAPGIPVARVVDPLSGGPMGYTYNDGVPPGDPASTAYDREFVLCYTDVWNEAHWDDAHIQLPDWSDFIADFTLLNGRVYPYTLEPNFDQAVNYPPGSMGELLRNQPISSLIQANAGERVLLRIINLTYRAHTFTLGGLKMHVHGKDAQLLRSAGGTDRSYITNSLPIGAGESNDVIFTAPAVTSQKTYLFYDRDYQYQHTGGAPGRGGPMTEVRIFPAGTLPPQTLPNT